MRFVNSLPTLIQMFTLRNAAAVFCAFCLSLALSVFVSVPITLAAPTFISHSQPSLLLGFENITNVTHSRYKAGDDILSLEVADFAARTDVDILLSTLLSDGARVRYVEGAAVYETDEYLFWYTDRQFVILESYAVLSDPVVNFFSGLYPSAITLPSSDMIVVSALSDRTTFTVHTHDTVQQLTTRALSPHASSMYINARDTKQDVLLSDIDFDVMLHTFFGQYIPPISGSARFGFAPSGELILKVPFATDIPLPGISLDPLYKIHKALTNHGSVIMDLDSGRVLARQGNAYVFVADIDSIFGSDTIRLSFEDKKWKLFYDNTSYLLFNQDLLYEYIARIRELDREVHIDINFDDLTLSVDDETYPLSSSLAALIVQFTAPWESAQVVIGDDGSVYFGVNRRSMKYTGISFDELSENITNYLSTLQTRLSGLELDISSGTLIRRQYDHGLKSDRSTLRNAPGLVASFRNPADRSALTDLFDSSFLVWKQDALYATTSSQGGSMHSAASDDPDSTGMGGLYISKFFHPRPWIGFPTL